MRRQGLLELLEDTPAGVRRQDARGCSFGLALVIGFIFHHYGVSIDIISIVRGGGFVKGVGIVAEAGHGQSPRVLGSASTVRLPTDSLVGT